MVFQLRSHGNDTVSHEFYFIQPLGFEIGVGEDLFDDTGTAEGWGGVHWSNQDFDLGVDSFGFFGGIDYHGEHSDSFAVHSHVFGEGLRESYFMAFGNKMAESEGVSNRVA